METKQKVVIINGNQTDIERLNKTLEDKWNVSSVTPNSIGQFVFVLEKQYCRAEELADRIAKGDIEPKASINSQVTTINRLRKEMDLQPIPTGDYLIHEPSVPIPKIGDDMKMPPHIRELQESDPVKDYCRLKNGEGKFMKMSKASTKGEDIEWVFGLPERLKEIDDKFMIEAIAEERRRVQYFDRVELQAMNWLVFCNIGGAQMPLSMLKMIL